MSDQAVEILIANAIHTAFIKYRRPALNGQATTTRGRSNGLALSCLNPPSQPRAGTETLPSGSAGLSPLRAGVY